MYSVQVMWSISERHLGSERQQVEEIIIIIFVHTQLNTTAMLQYVFTLDPNPCLVLFLPCVPLHQCEASVNPEAKLAVLACAHPPSLTVGEH